MKLSRKTDYALRAIFDLADQPAGLPVSIRALAERNDIPKRFLEQIMLELRGLGWVRSVAGREGGYVLAADPNALTMGQIVRHFDGILAPVWCVSVTSYEPCSQESRCRFRRILLEIRNYTARVMDNASIARILSSSPVSRQEVFSDQMIGGLGI
jgi:Rrf2 family protein